MTAIMNGPGAWVIGGQNRLSYNVEPLLSAKKVHTSTFEVRAIFRHNRLT
jgi:hypothetical protein